jgi:hypothetical protein
MVTCQELQDLNFGKLNTAVTQWKQMLDKLVLLADGGDGGINAADFERKATAADWKGDNATVTKEFTTTTARQFDDMVTEARSIHKILQEAATNLKKNQDDLKAAIDKWAKQWIYIDAKGAAMYSGPPREVEGGPKEQPSQEVVDSAAAEIAKILEAANETDRIAARALRKHAESKYDFDEKGYSGLKDADRRQGIEDADAMVKLAGKGDQLTDAELKRFNEIAKYHRDNPAFAERFATKLGADGTLEFWRSIADPGQGRTPEPGSDRAKILAKVQDNLGITLANASRSDSPEMQQWKDRMIELGDDHIKSSSGIPSAPYGFKVLGPLMTEGKWDTDFLNKYGTRLLEFERKSDDPVLGGPDQLWNSHFDPAQLSYPPGATKPESDPVADLMEALGHNPEASLEFFNGSSGKGDDAMSNWDYLVEKGGDGAREWPTDEDGRTTGFKNLGHALEAGTLGYAYDDKNPSIPPLDSADAPSPPARSAPSSWTGSWTTTRRPTSSTSRTASATAWPTWRPATSTASTTPWPTGAAPEQPRAGTACTTPRSSACATSVRRAARTSCGRWPPTRARTRRSPPPSRSTARVRWPPRATSRTRWTPV